MDSKDTKAETMQDKVRNIEHFLAVEVSEMHAQKSILESVGAVEMDGMPRGSRKTEDGAQMQYESICEELRAVRAVLGWLTCTERAVCQGMINGERDIEIYQKIGYSRSYYAHKIKKQALLRFAGLYPLRQF